MITYHILWKENSDDFYSKGRNFEATTPEEAIGLWKLHCLQEYNLQAEHCVFMAMYIIES